MKLHTSLKRSTARPVTVTICMLTYKRPVMLRAALLSLAAQRLVENPDIELELILVDNDVACSGASTFEVIRDQFPYPAYYIVERRQGLAYARNRALTESTGTDFVAFLDDDETADPLWIDTLLTVQRLYDADVVSGPVIPTYDGAPEWIVEGNFFASRQYPTGTPIDLVETNNVLFRGLYARQFRFDLRFNKTAGEDTHFFMQLEHAGARMVWAAEARVHETITRERTSIAWLLDRAQSEANRYTRSCLYIKPGFKTRALRLTRAAGALAKGSLLVLAGLTRPHRAVHGLSYISRALGTLKGLLDLSHTHYNPFPSPPSVRRPEPIAFTRRAEDRTGKNARRAPKQPALPAGVVEPPTHPAAPLELPRTMTAHSHASLPATAYHGDHAETRTQETIPDRRQLNHPGHAGRPDRPMLVPDPPHHNRRHRLQELHPVSHRPGHDEDLPDPR
jgi:succinoglycan biosynthesis protein ExoM